MKTPFKDLPPLHLASGTDGLKEQLQQIVFEGTIATTTDGNILVRYDLQENEFANYLDNKAINFLHWKDLYSNRKRIIDITVEDNMLIAFLNNKIKLIYPISEIINYPNYKNILPKEFNEIDSIGINPTYLQTIYKIANISDGIRLDFTHRFKAIEITSFHNENFYALLMPCMIYDKTSTTKFK
jgi:DNA polymerase III sliding clamp (beta) subunit (PCNA family)